jgi:hypothetical protein
MIGMHEVGTRAGIQIAEHVIFEAGEGKSEADSDGNCVGVTLRGYVNEGNDLHGAADLKQGLDHGAREGSGVPAVNMEMILDRQKEAKGETVGKKAKSAVKPLRAWDLNHQSSCLGEGRGKAARAFWDRRR